MNEDRIENEYFEWMYDLVCGKRYSKSVSYRTLLMYLHSTEFIYSIPKDRNRAVDGIGLRRRFALSENCEEKADYLTGPCSVLEMMIALSIRCEEGFMDDPTVGDRTGQWFWGMIVNLGLGPMTDNRFDKHLVHDILTRFLKREYEADGRGGLFTVNHSKYDMRDVEIWTQKNYYLDEYLGLS